MPSPFSGMDPYLEHPALWPDVHNRLLVAIANALTPVLRPRYYVAIEERTYTAGPGGLLFVGRPDVTVVGPPVREKGHRAPQAIPVMTDTLTAPVVPGVLTVAVPMPDIVREIYLEVREPATGEVITVVEILFPTNKRPGEGRRLYEEKRLLTLGTRTHLVEIDLLREGEPMPMEIPEPAPQAGYRILVSRSGHRPQALLYTFTVRDPIPVFPLPLRSGDEEPPVDLGTLLQEVYDRAGYDLRVDYRGQPTPPLGEEEARWADRLLRQLRQGEGERG